LVCTIQTALVGLGKMIDFHHFTNYNRTDAELEEALLGCIVVAGKKADVQARKLDRVLAWGDAGSGKPPTVGARTYTPFQCIRRLIISGRLAPVLLEAALGQYYRITAAFTQIVCPDKFSIVIIPRSCRLEDLEAITGIGPKTARMFLLHTRPGQRLAVLDRHVLRWMATVGEGENSPDQGQQVAFQAIQAAKPIPTATPPAGATYARLEAAYLAACDALGKDPAEYDLALWNAKAKRYSKHDG